MITVLTHHFGTSTLASSTRNTSIFLTETQLVDVLQYIQKMIDL